MIKSVEHFRTIFQHKMIVMRECFCCAQIKRGLLHDITKFMPTEFISSARYYQGNRSPIDAEKEDKGYSAAWLHHKGHNPHHWEYWTDFDKNGNVIANKIPFKYVVEMACDYVGASIVYSRGNWTQNMPLDYFKKVRNGRHYHPETEKLIIEFLNCINEKGLDEFHKLAKIYKTVYQNKE